MNRKKVLVVQVDMSHYDSDDIGEFCKELDDKLSEYYEVLLIPKDISVFCPDDETCVKLMDGLLSAMSTEEARKYLEGAIKGIEIERSKEG